MKRRTIELVLLLALLVGIPTLELVREEFVYLRLGKTLESAYKEIKTDMTKQDVVRLARMPDLVRGEGDAEFWYWDVSYHQGKLWRILGLVSEKGHETLAVEFNGEGKVARRWGGIN